MTSRLLPKTVRKTLVPPVKCQGIKTKLVPFILANIRWDGRGRWIEPFLGSGVVLYNVQPQRAVGCDTNPHIVYLYRSIYDGSVTPDKVRTHLTREGKTLAAEGERHYYLVRDRFNEMGAALDFIFLNRSCFNGLMRFNRKGGFNVPFCRKPNRFRQALVTKIVNQIAAIRQVMQGRDWEFRSEDWHDCLKDVTPADFVYLDPPYVGRHTDYYSQWSDGEAKELANTARSLPCGFALSMWKRNKYRVNSHLVEHWGGMVQRSTSHFYHVGATENLRNEMEEALVIKRGYDAPEPVTEEAAEARQMSLSDSLASTGLRKERLKRRKA